MILFYGKQLLFICDYVSKLTSTDMYTTNVASHKHILSQSGNVFNVILFPNIIYYVGYFLSFYLY